MRGYRRRALSMGNRPLMSNRRDNIFHRPTSIRIQEPESESEEEEEKEQLGKRINDDTDGEHGGEPLIEFDMSEIRKAKLPKKMIVMKNPDKVWHESWYKGRDLVDIVHPFRLLLFGPPNTGKSNTLRNVILRAGVGKNQPFEDIMVVHCDPDYTKEYKDLDCTMLNEIPTPDQWAGEVKTLVILEDLEFKNMSKQDRRSIDRLYGYVSTHKNISVALCAQDAFNIPVSVRRTSNFFILWRTPDIDSMANIARRTGMKKDQFIDIFDRLLPDFHDSLWIDLTPGTKQKLRKNGYIPIKMGQPKII